MDSKTWPCAVIAILMCAAGTMSQAQESGPPQPTPRDDPATSGAGPTSRAPGQFDYDPPKGASVTTDQRGELRIVNSAVDIGAFESSGFTIAVSSGSGQSTSAYAAFSAPLSLASAAPRPRPMP